jgi:hypothetical protein
MKRSIFPRGSAWLILALSCAAPLASRAANGPESEYLNQGVESSLTVAWDSPYPDFRPEVDYYLSAGRKNSKVYGSVEVALWDAIPGNYSVAAHPASSGASIPLGTITVSSGTTITTLPGFAYPLWQLPGNSRVIFGGKNNALPKGLDPLDIESVSVSDSNGMVIASGTFTGQEQYNLISVVSRLDVEGAPASDDNFAMIRYDDEPYLIPGMVPAAAGASTSGSGIVISGTIPAYIFPVTYPPGYGAHLLIHARGLPPDIRVTYALDGTEIATVTTSNSGDLFLTAWQTGVGPNTGPIPSSVNFFLIKNLTIRNLRGRVLASASF